MIEPLFIDYLLGTGESPETAIAALVEDRLYVEELPQNPTLPALTYELLGTETPILQDGTAGYKRTVIKVTAFATTAKQAGEIIALVRTRMLTDPSSGFQTAEPEDEAALGPDTQLGIYAHDIDCVVFHHQ